MKRNEKAKSVNEVKDESVNENGSYKNESAVNKINLDYDWNSEYGDGDIPDIDK